MLDLLQWVGWATASLGAVCIAHQGRWVRHGFVICLGSNVLWTAFALLTNAPGLVATQVVFAAINVYGLSRPAGVSTRAEWQATTVTTVRPCP